MTDKGAIANALENPGRKHTSAGGQDSVNLDLKSLADVDGVPALTEVDIPIDNRTLIREIDATGITPTLRFDKTSGDAGTFPQHDLVVTHRSAIVVFPSNVTVQEPGGGDDDQLEIIIDNVTAKTPSVPFKNATAALILTVRPS